MKKTISILTLILIIFLGYVSTRSSHFRIERSGLINAPAEKIYPYLSSFEKCALWNPYDQKDPNMKRTMHGTDGQVGSVMEFEGNKDVGAGKLEFIKFIPNQLVEVRLIMTTPMKVDNLIRYQLTPEGAATRFSWSMEGDNGFIGKLFSVFIDCEKMMSGDFEKGIAQLKALVEKS